MVNLLVGPLFLQHAHQIFPGPRIWRRLLSSPIQAKGMAGICGRGFRCGKGVRRVQLESEAGIEGPQETRINRPQWRKMYTNMRTIHPTRARAYDGQRTIQQSRDVLSHTNRRYLRGIIDSGFFSLSENTYYHVVMSMTYGANPP
jgi:hypothetical protein